MIRRAFLLQAYESPVTDFIIHFIGITIATKNTTTYVCLVFLYQGFFILMFITIIHAKLSAETKSAVEFTQNPTVFCHDAC